MDNSFAPVPPKTLVEKLLNIRMSVDSLTKVNQGHGFKYVSSGQVLGSLRVAMNEQRVLLIPHILQGSAKDHTTAGGKTWKFTELIINYEWVNVDAPEDKFTVPFYAQGMDDMEKGVGKALTYGEKYFVLKFFNIPTDKDDPDAYIPRLGGGRSSQEASSVAARELKKSVDRVFAPMDRAIDRMEKVFAPTPAEEANPQLTARGKEEEFSRLHQSASNSLITPAQKALLQKLYKDLSRAITDAELDAMKKSQASLLIQELNKERVANLAKSIVDSSQ